MTGKELLELTRETFKLEDTSKVTPKQLDYVLSTLKPSNYLLAHHTIKGKPLTFNIPNYDISRALMHRPWQVGIINDMSRDVIIIKSRQLGLSEIGIAQMIYFLDTHSYDNVKGLYTFPNYRSLKTFYKTRIVPEFNSGYYSTLVDKLHGMSQEQMNIRNSTLVFRTSSKAGSVEGIDIDFASLDEYDH